MDVNPLNFTLSTVDLKVVNYLYPNMLTNYSLLDTNSGILQEVSFSSPIFIIHPHVNEYNKLYDAFRDIEKSGDKQQMKTARAHYVTQVAALDQRILSDISKEFEDAIYINSKSKTLLHPHFDTLLFICLGLYNTMWDPYGISFNGPIANYSIDELSPNAQPYYYRGITQTKFIAKLLYYHFKKPHIERSATIFMGGIPHTSDDIDWLLTSLFNGDIPLYTDTFGMGLISLLKKRKEMDPKVFLDELYNYTKLKAYDYSNYKRKAVCDYCIEVHKAFSYYLKLPINSLTGKRSKIYHNILTAFKMDDFNVDQRTLETVTTRADKAYNRLTTLLRPKIKALECN